jgi:hypothetical protein
MSGVLFWQILEGWLDEGVRFAALALFLFNPVVAGLSSAVMSDVCLLFFALLVMRMLRQASIGKGLPFWVLGLLLGWAAVVRPIALFLLPAAGVALIQMRGWRQAMKALIPAIVIWAAVLLRNHFAADEITRYSRYWEEGLPLLLREPVAVLSQWHRTAYLFFGTSLTGASLPRTRGGFFASLVLVGAVAWFFANGFLFLWRERARRPLLGAIAVFVGGCFVVQAFWPIQDTRYFLPLVPFGLIFLVVGISSRRSLFASALLAVVCAYGLQNGRLLAETWSAQRLRVQIFPRGTMEWLEGHTPENGLLLGKVPTIYLYTRRQGLPAVLADDAEEFRYRCLRQGVTHVVSLPVSVITIAGAKTVDQDRTWKQNMGWASSWPEAFEPVYENPKEGSAVFRLVPDRHFTSAYALYLAAREDLVSGGIGPGLKALDRALRLRPRLVCALNVKGAALMLDGRLAQAERPLLAALEIRPDHALALVNLARLRVRQGRPDEARRLYARAKTSRSRTGEFYGLGPALEAEAAALH